jgi:hypothetical protein
VCTIECVWKAGFGLKIYSIKIFNAVGSKWLIGWLEAENKITSLSDTFSDKLESLFALMRD